MEISYILKFRDSFLDNVKSIKVMSTKRTMPIQAPLWTEFLICPICTKEFAENRLPISLGCSHTICKNCLGTLHRTQCPFDQTNITTDINTLPINYALLQLVSSSPNIEREINAQIIKSLQPDELVCYETATQCIEKLALLLKPNGNASGLLSRPMQRKLVTLISCQLFDNEGRTRSLRAARSLGERVVTELILQHQNPQQLSQNLWAAVRARGCQFLGPAMQEEVLKLVLLALEDGNDLSRKILVLYVVQKLQTTFPQASKTSIGHVVQLLYRASCFKVSKRESDSSLMTLKEEFRTYESLRREHDTQIVQIATEAGLRIAPDQWSSLLYGDSNHKSHMQSIIDKQQSPSSFSMSVNELVMALQRTGDPANLARLRTHMDNLALIDASTDSNVVPTWDECSNALKAVKSVVFGLIDFIQKHGNRKMPETSHLTHASRYKVSFCRELKIRGHCARGNSCNFAHSEQELERFRTKFKKNASRVDVVSAPHGSNNNGSGSSNNNGNPMRDLTNYAVSSGPNSKANMNNHHHSNQQHHHHHPQQQQQQQQQHQPFGKGQDGVSGNSQRFNKPMPYRSENSLYNSPMTPHHLKPTNVFPNASSTPNLSVQLSPNQQKAASNGPRFAFNGSNGNGNTNNHNTYSASTEQAKNMSLLNSGKYLNYTRPPLSAPPMGHSSYNSFAKSPDYNKKQQQQQQLSPYGNVPMNSSSSPNQLQQQQQHQKGHPHHHHGNSSGVAAPPVMGSSQFHNNNNNNSSGYYSMIQSPSTSPYFPFSANSRANSGSDEFNNPVAFSEPPKYPSWKQQQLQQQKSPVNSSLLPKNHTSHQISKFSPYKSSPGLRYDNIDVPPAVGATAAAHDFKRGGVNHPARLPMQMNMMYQQQHQQQQQALQSGGSDDIDGSMWKYQHLSSSNMKVAAAPTYSFPNATTTTTTITSMNKDKFIRSDSILTSNTDESFESMPNPNGRFGPIGIKSSETAEWSGLQQSAAANRFDISSSDSFKSSMMMNSSEATSSSNGDSGSGSDLLTAQNTLNGNFLNMQIGDSSVPPPSPTTRSLWSSKTSQQWNQPASSPTAPSRDFDSFGNDQIAINLWHLISD